MKVHSALYENYYRFSSTIARMQQECLT